MKIFFLRLGGIVALGAVFLTGPFWVSIGLGLFLSTIFNWYAELIIFSIILSSIYDLNVVFIIFITVIALAVQEFLKKQTHQNNLLSAILILLVGIFLFYVGIIIFIYIKSPEAFNIKIVRGIIPATTLGSVMLMIKYKIWQNTT